MIDYQVPLPGLAEDFNNLTKEERAFIKYFSTIDNNCISPVVDCYAGIGPQGYGTPLILALIVKVKERILSGCLELISYVKVQMGSSHHGPENYSIGLALPGLIEKINIYKVLATPCPSFIV